MIFRFESRSPDQLLCQIIRDVSQTNRILFWRKLQDLMMSRDSVVDIATGYGLDDRGVGVLVPVVSRIFSFPHRSDWHWGPPSLLSNRYRG
jgi:hypothetical protein